MNRYLYLLLFILIWSCTKDRAFLLEQIQQPDPIGDFYLLHYWNFNNARDDAALIAPSFSTGSASMTYAGAYFDMFEEGTVLNARVNDIGGTSLRLRNPSGDWVIKFSTSDHANIKISFAVQRSGSGARIHQYEYSLDGVNYSSANIRPTQVSIGTSWQVVSIDFFEAPEINNREVVYLKVRFSDNADNESGNNRIDNLTIEGTLPGIVIDKDNISDPEAALIHYWHFNTLSTPTDVKEVEGDFAAPDLPIGNITYTGSSNRDMDEFEPGTSMNTYLDQPAGKGLRVRNRSEDRTLLLNVSTKGYQNIKFSYAVQRSGSGMLNNIVTYSVDGINFSSEGISNSTVSVAEDWQVFNFDLSNITTLNDLENLQIRISFEGNTELDNGNNRYDNIAFVGKKI